MTELPTIHTALANVKKAVGNVSKSQRNQQQGFNFRGIDDVVNAASGPLNEFGVITVPELQSYTIETVEVGRNKTPMAHIMGLVDYVFFGPAGDKITARVLAESMDSGDKGTAKMMSVAYRTALLQVLNLPTDAPDPDHDVYERSGGNDEQAAQALRAATRTTRPKPETAESAPAAEKATEADIARFVKMVESAKTADQLNKAFGEISAKGALTTEITVKGQKTTFQKLMYSRNDAIKSQSGNNGAAAG